MSPRARSYCLAFALLGVATSVAHAQGPTEQQLAEARDLFRRGVEHAAAGEFAQAEQRFRAALAITDAPTVRYNLHAALFEQGKHVEAYRELQHVVASDETPQELRARAEEAEGHIREQLGLIRIDLRGSLDGAAIDGNEVPADQLGTLVPVEPGPHEVAALRHGEVVSRRQLELGPGHQAHVDLIEIPTPAETAAQSPGEPTPTDGCECSKKWLWVGIATGGGALLIAITIVIAVLAGG